MLELKHISFEAGEGGTVKEIIRDVNLTLPDNKFIAVTGPNGGGKSTLAKLIVGIEQPIKGQILLDGEDITGLGITERAKKGVSFAFQQPVRFKGITVRDLIGLAAGENISTARACNYLSEVGLCAKDYINREVNASLSGGELKRIEIATVLARKTKLTVFDEPEAGIDLWSFSMLVKQFEQLHENKTESLVIISHQERIMQMADRIMIVRDGEIQAVGEKEKVLPELMGGEKGCTCLNEAAK